ncbi:Linoleoyl-CoA desaturase [Anaeromyxobacter dehalogenans 2CP-1]|uniref:Linoleoyl-CoA desaturase n=1 Tax=Anaeromyxobacter dehalogenans (strain ATCC BAA-258 / DSM 21875 / 2CP-1) TaxID=455488 RepID=B8JHK1_ANAD2|nr:acyl-CoA desaturase [Anaeromyxobacter dehalogenans]ACL66713.1 Linoleoyl-CoA desaturase [Anaeromyxobacter dehalogenans 2CP-1]
MTASALRARFPRDDGFHADLKRRVAAYFAATGEPAQGGRAMHVKTAAIFGWFGASYALLLAWGDVSAWLAIGLTVSIALATAGIGFSVMHDANHGAYSRSPRVNRAVGLALDFIGASSYVWRFKHNVQHHTYTNVAGLDADIDAEPFLRLAGAQRRRALHRFQGAYAWPLYGVLSLKWWLVDDVVDLVRGTIGGHPYPRPRGRELAAVVAGKATFLGWALVVPVLVHGSAWPVAFFVLGSLVLGVVMAVVFQLAHAVSGAQFHDAPAADGRMPAAWAEHQVRTTVDFARSSRVLAWYLGGLNFQIEHHLFPGVCHVRYPALATIVEETCRAHGIPYRAEPSLGAAIAAHHRHLRALGAPVPA